MTLSPEIEFFISSQIASGAYRTREEVLTDALRLLRLRQEYEDKRAELLEDLDVGISQLERGEGIETTIEEIFESAMQSVN